VGWRLRRAGCGVAASRQPPALRASAHRLPRRRRRPRRRLAAGQRVAGRGRRTGGRDRRPGDRQPGRPHRHIGPHRAEPGLARELERREGHHAARQDARAGGPESHHPSVGRRVPRLAIGPGVGRGRLPRGDAHRRTRHVLVLSIQHGMGSNATRRSAAHRRRSKAGPGSGELDGGHWRCWPMPSSGSPRAATRTLRRSSR